MEVRQKSDTVLTRFGHAYYLLRLLACFPALLYLLVLLPAHSAQQQINFLLSSRVALIIPLIAIPVLVLARLTQLKKSFNLLTLSLETLLDTWLVHFLAFNFGSLALLGGWIPTTTYLACLISFGLLCPKPAYLGSSKLRVMDPETFTTEILNRTYSSVTGFSASELLNLTTEKLATQLDNHQQDRQVYSTKKWIIWPLSEARKRSHVGFMDMEIILANLSLEFGSSLDEREFIILDLKNTTSLTYTLKIWSEDDSASSPVQPEVDALVLLEYQAGREINRLPARQLINDESSDEEEDSEKDSLSTSTVVWSQQTITKAFKLKK
ncbi:hypothetical protein PCASD_19990 [Puccinia coronata f. sp. avenae]|uniref:Uncharacterized protein n=1 Tax=Puccinia coronata f. sp. avenae TaxID=200324 RepID=A0A2N5TXS0_9BASI|nr:hypothetical protein PCASD_19990 [Puccinia coronata f. sp. avenae]